MRMRNLDLLVCSLNFIEDHLRNDLKTTDIANACCCSKSTLEKMFQYVYSTSVHRYVIYRRMMLAAKSLTEQPDISVLTVAVEFDMDRMKRLRAHLKKFGTVHPLLSASRNIGNFTRVFGNRFRKENIILWREKASISANYMIYFRNERTATLYAAILKT